jgi:hypothetical protein
MNVENIASTWMRFENMALASTADGLGLATSILREEHKVAVEKLLGIPEDYKIATMVLIGVKKCPVRDEAACDQLSVGCIEIGSAPLLLQLASLS